MAARVCRDELASSSCLGQIASPIEICVPELSLSGH